MMLFIIGLGLWNEKDISMKGYETVLKADEVYVEFYTSKLCGSNLKKLKKFFKKEIVKLDRKDLEDYCDLILEKAKDKDIAILVPGDPVIATTHIALMIEAQKIGVEVKIIHASSIISAVCALTGLHSYKFGKSATISYPYKNMVSRTPITTIKDNRNINAHTLLYLDLHPKPMTINEGIKILEQVDDGFLNNCYAVGVARAGSDFPTVKCDKIKKLKKFEFGPPLHALVVLSPKLHFLEYEFLRTFASAPRSLKKFVE